MFIEPGDRTCEIGRREFVQTVGIAAAVYAAGGAEANAATAPRGFTGIGVNHISYSCPDYTKARDFYKNVMGMQVINDKGMGRANLAFGPEAGKGGNFLVVHNPGRNPPPPTSPSRCRSPSCATLTRRCAQASESRSTRLIRATRRRSAPSGAP